jgi:hypothetical protein
VDFNENAHATADFNIGDMLDSTRMRKDCEAYPPALWEANLTQGSGIEGSVFEFNFTGTRADQGWQIGPGSRIADHFAFFVYFCADVGLDKFEVVAILKSTNFAVTMTETIAAVAYVGNNDSSYNPQSRKQDLTEIKPIKKEDASGGHKRKERRQSSEYRGVCWCKARTKWRAQIRYAGKDQHLGYFKNEKEAARSYDEAARQRHGEMAQLNFSAVEVGTFSAALGAGLNGEGTAWTDSSDSLDFLLDEDGFKDSLNQDVSDFGKGPDEFGIEFPHAVEERQEYGGDVLETPLLQAAVPREKEATSGNAHCLQCCPGLLTEESDTDDEGNEGDEGDEGDEGNEGDGIRSDVEAGRGIVYQAIEDREEGGEGGKGEGALEHESDAWSEDLYSYRNGAYGCTTRPFNSRLTWLRLVVTAVTCACAVVSLVVVQQHTSTAPTPAPACSGAWNVQLKSNLVKMGDGKLPWQKLYNLSMGGRHEDTFDIRCTNLTQPAPTEPMENDTFYGADGTAFYGADGTAPAESSFYGANGTAQPEGASVLSKCTALPCCCSNRNKHPRAMHEHCEAHDMLTMSLHRNGVAVGGLQCCK